MKNNFPIKQIKTIFFICLLLLIIIGGLYYRYIYYPIPLKKLYPSAHINQIKEKLTQIPLSDRKLLKSFLRYNFKHNDFAYSLFGKKPMVLEGFLTEEKLQELTKKFPKVNFQSKLQYFEKIGWELWEKYQHLFPSKRYTFTKVMSSKRDGFVNIFFFNKPVCLKVIHKNKNLFDHVSGKHLSAEEYLDLIISPTTNQLFLSNDEILGTLLGYGRKNAFLFKRRTELLDIFYPENSATGKRKKYLSLFVDPSEKTQKMLEELSQIEKTLLRFTGEKRKCLSSKKYVKMIGFMADPKSKETKKLRQNYKKAQKMINRLMYANDGDLLFLCQFSME